VLSHITLGTNDLPRALAFYDGVMGSLGLGQVAAVENEAAGYGRDRNTAPQLWITRPFNGAAASVGNGQMVAFEAPDRATVDRFHAEILAAGGTDEGAPGLRPNYHPDYYGAYARDPDGNKLHCVCRQPE
jgi:catechol 2,3-dioxygenase-like lactoylglutathione lyase family enzyme